MTDLIQDFVTGVIVNYDQLGTFDRYVSLGVNQMDTIHGRCRSLVKLSGQEFHSDVFRQIDRIRDLICDYLAEHAVAAFLKQFRSEAEQVINI